MLKKIYSYAFCLSLFFTCDVQKKKDISSVVPIINIENSLSDFRITPLSNYVSQIRYLKLEMKEECLVTQEIKKIYLEKGQLFIHDNEPFLKVFDANTGRYLYNIGKKGQGPGELAQLYYFDICPDKEEILLSGDGGTYKFSINGTFIGKVEKPSIYGIELDSNVAFLNDGLYGAGLRYPKQPQEYAIVLFDEQQNIVSSLKSYKDPIQHPTIKAWSTLIQSGFFYRNGKEIRHYRGISDTIYTYNSEERRFIPVYSFNWGKHQPHEYYDPKSQNPDEIHLSQKTISENNEFFFFDFLSKRASPEPFKEIVFRFDQWHEINNNNIYGIYDKDKRQLHFLLQPIPGVRGLKNDLDGGIPFWPKSISSNYQMLDYYHAGSFLELAKKIKNPNESFSAFVRTCSEEDNPVVIIVE
ncbi:6-bladed beta-propeller [Massilibacteroides vaginae]|uniref:6-bladed beta-propeller n=1 Tax=Massilibacteroides vaginae TaxID=1673718 RepID=UPI000A1CE3B6|nr:6-bladed beta-propeller [Massilibacteroides vaginae]